MNQKANKHFRYAETSKKHIRARWNEGYQLDDFKKVIDIKCVDWLVDPKMNEYLRPSTLFGAKFESYLNSKPRKKKNGYQKSRIETATNWDEVKAEEVPENSQELQERLAKMRGRKNATN